MSVVTQNSEQGPFREKIKEEVSLRALCDLQQVHASELGESQ